MEKPRVRVYLDDEPQPIVDQELPTRGFARYHATWRTGRTG